MKTKGIWDKCGFFFFFVCDSVVLLCVHQDSIPFAVIGSNTVVEAKGKRVRGRLYPWGIVEGGSASSSSSSSSSLPLLQSVSRT